MARAHRIGQTRSVRVYRLLTAKTYEMHMFHSASLKLGLDRAVLAHQRQGEESKGSGRKSKAEKEEQAKEIDSLLKKGAYDVFRDDDDNEAQKFMDTDIEQLLEQSSRKVTYGETATASLSTGLGSFSKASFVTTTGDGDDKDVDLDDPDFWEKVIHKGDNYFDIYHVKYLTILLLVGRWTRGPTRRYGSRYGTYHYRREQEITEAS